MVNMLQKKCYKCGETKLTTEFYRDCSRKDGIESCCKDCKKKYDQTPARRIAIKKKNNKVTPEKRLFYGAKNRAKKRGLEFSITLADIVMPKKCPVFGIPIFKTNGEFKFDPNCASLDRIDNSRGYTRDNVWVISGKANFIKKDATIDELKRLVEGLIKYGI